MWMPFKDEYYKHPEFRGLVLRKNSTDLDDWISRAEEVYSKFGANYVGGRKSRFEFPSGAYIKTGHLKDKHAYKKYQGHEYHRILFEELTHIPFEEDYKKVISSCRSTVDGLDPQVLATTNPTGRGHNWVKKRFVKGENVPDPREVWTPEETGRGRVYLPATVEDNPTLMKKDPNYVNVLEGLDGELAKAWRFGSWDVGAGQFFPSWDRNVHVCKPFHIPDHWLKYISVDYGYASNSAVYWNAVVPETGKVYTYREMYVTRHTYTQLISGIARSTPKDESIAWLVADNSIAAETNESGKSGEDIFRDYLETIDWNVIIHLANKGAGSRVRGWNLMREYLKPDIDDQGRREARWQIFDRCEKLIETLPEMVHDERNPEDIDSEAEDHAVDSIRYGFQSLNQALSKKVDEQEEPEEVRKRKAQGVLTAEELFEKVEGGG